MSQKGQGQHIVAFWVAPEEKSRLMALARRERRSLSAFVRLIVARGTERHTDRDATADR